MYKTYHVSINGSDFSEGSADQPFKTISKAALVAQKGDCVVVHQGEYREWVKPFNSGYSNLERITYMAAEGEKVVIKGSEIIKNWEKVDGTVWKVVLSNSFFGDYNPYNTKLIGDWFMYPKEWCVHTGDVYLNGRSFFEARSLDDVKNPLKRDKGYTPPASDRVEYILDSDFSIYQWFAEVDDEYTTIYANFHGSDPNMELTEINVRKCCFFPEKTNINYITVRGFEMSQAATPWVPPTAYQFGLLGANWSKGWIIENNKIHDSKCSGISIGKEGSSGDNLCYKTQQKSGYQYQQEAVFKAIQIGWSKETVGSHIIRNNKIFDCGQNGIVGHLGCVFSEIYGNHIFNIGKKHEFFGWEIAGIKFHAPIDVVIRNNRIHNCSLGLWLDWQCQGTRVSKNLLYNNDRDCTIEVTHGPLLFDNNILASTYNFDNHAQGTAFVNNLFAGKMRIRKILDRATPYHYPHTTQVAGYAFVYTGDERIYNNIFIGDLNSGGEYRFGTSGYNYCTASYDEFHKGIVEKGFRDEDKFVEVEQPVYINENAYMNHAEPFNREGSYYNDENFNPELKIVDSGETVYLELNVKSDLLSLKTRIHSTETLGSVRLVDAIYDDPNGNSIVLDLDYQGVKRGSTPCPGPLEGLKTGLNRFRVW